MYVCMQRWGEREFSKGNNLVLWEVNNMEENETSKEWYGMI